MSHTPTVFEILKCTDCGSEPPIMEYVGAFAPRDTKVYVCEQCYLLRMKHYESCCIPLITGTERELCVRCGVLTPYERRTQLQFRKCFIENIGQHCAACYHVVGHRPEPAL